MHRWVEHTGELELELEAPSEPAVFEQALAAMRELLADGEGEQLPPRAVALRAGDRAALLADWLSELAFLAETEGFVPVGVAGLELEGGSLRAELRGRRGAPPNLVKAATYHRLALEPFAGGWRARVVLDV